MAYLQGRGKAYLQGYFTGLTVFQFLVDTFFMDSMDVMG